MDGPALGWRQLAAVLAVCRKKDKHSKAKREKCEKAAHKKFGPAKKGTKKK